MQSRYLPTLLWFLLLYALVILALLGTGGEKFEHLHLILDISNSILSLLLMLFLLGEQHQIQPNVRKYLAIGFGFAAATELLHALIGIEWSGWFAWIQTYSGTLRPATWPPSTYVLPLAMAWAFWLIRRKSALRPALFATGVALLTAGLLALSLSLPRYVDTGILGIQRPTQVPLLLLWAGVIAVYWRERRTHPLYEGLALMGVMLFLSDLCMLYSTSPHEKFTMMAHTGKMLAYTLLHVIQMRIAAADSQGRSAAEAALRESEVRFRNLVETTSDWIWEVDENIVFTYVSPKIHDILGYEAVEIIGKTPFDLMTSEEAKRVADIAGTIAATRKPFTNLENTNLHKDGHPVVIETSGVPVIDTEGKFYGYRGINRDITERKEFEEELKRSNVELEQFSYAVSHDMRQPLRMISSYLQLLEMSLDGQLDGEKRDYFNFAIEGAKRIDQMLVALLEYSRVGKAGELPAWIESRAVLDETLQFLQPAIAEAQARVSIAGDWPRIMACHDEILRLLQNLIGNAAKYRIAGRTPEITVTSKIDKNEWCLCVADNGVGIIPDQIKRLFQVFQRLQLRTAYEGNGVGLALCRKIAEHHKGRIWAESAGEGHGSRFCVVLLVLRKDTISAREKIA